VIRQQFGVGPDTPALQEPGTADEARGSSAGDSIAQPHENQLQLRGTLDAGE